MRHIIFRHSFNDIISIENLLEAWRDFRKGKRNKRDVQEFERDLMCNVIELHHELVGKTYKHSPYEFFRIHDPKPRDIHKAKVRDRLLHHAIYRKLYSSFDKTFIADSFSCRLDKGTHKALDRFKLSTNKVSKNHTKTVRVLKCDVRKFFASIDQKILLQIISKHIKDQDTMWLISEIVGSFESNHHGVGLPLGNLTSQLFVNIYMNEFDQYVKHKLKAKYYIRYADDFVIMSRDRDGLVTILPKIRSFLSDQLKLTLHPDKVFIKTAASGVDFLGWVHFPTHRVLRTSTKRRMLRNLSNSQWKDGVVQSYLGLLRHGNCWKLRNSILKASKAF